MAEEHRSQAPRLALNQTLTAATIVASTSSSLTSSSSSASFSVTSSSSAVDSVDFSCKHSQAVVVNERNQKKEEDEERLAVRPNRCLTCRKRVGLTRFKCHI